MGIVSLWFCGIVFGRRVGRVVFEVFVDDFGVFEPAGASFLMVLFYVG